MESFNRKVALLGCGCAALAVAPAFLSSYTMYVVATWMVYAIAASGLNIPFGFTRLHCFGQGAFMLIGAYSVALAASVKGWPIWTGFIIGVLLAGLLGLLLALPTRTLKGFALAILTFTLALTLSRTVKSLEFAGGPQGLVLKPVKALGMSAGLFSYELTLLCFGLSLLVVISVTTSKSGHAMRTVGANEIVAQALGINPLRYRVMSMVLSACLGAVAGCLQPLLVGQVAPDTYEPSLSIDLFAAVMIGGIGSLIGPLLGALFIVATPELLQASQQFSQMIFAVVFLIVTVLFPGGLVGLAASIVRRVRRVVGGTRGAQATVGSAP